MREGEDSLPILACLDEIVTTLSNATPVVVKAPPGAGKTTGVPPALLQSRTHGNGKILLIQPRRLAARAAASRLAALQRCKLGTQVGYQIRFDHRANKDTQLIAMTTGILLRRLASDPLLEEVQCVLLDEFHERSLEADLALGMLRRIRYRNPHNEGDTISSRSVYTISSGRGPRWDSPFFFSTRSSLP